MKRVNQQGTIVIIIMLVVTGVLLVGSLGFGVWAFSGRQDYKNNLDSKITAAVEVEKARISSTKDNEYAVKDKSPVKTFKGPGTYGDLSIEYPKNWSPLIEVRANGDPVVDGYWYPEVLPGINGGIKYSLRVRIVDQQYSSSVGSYKDDIKAGKANASAFIPEKVSSIKGTRIDGKISDGKTGSLILLPLRDKTIRIYTEDSQYIADFNKYVLPSISYNP